MRRAFFPVFVAVAAAAAICLAGCGGGGGGGSSETVVTGLVASDVPVAIDHRASLDFLATNTGALSLGSAGAFRVTFIANGATAQALSADWGVSSNDIQVRIFDTDIPAYDQAIPVSLAFRRSGEASDTWHPIRFATPLTVTFRRQP